MWCINKIEYYSPIKNGSTWVKLESIMLSNIRQRKINEIKKTLNSVWGDGYYLNHRGNNFTIYVNQTIVLYTLNLHSEVCQLLFNKTGRKC